MTQLPPRRSNYDSNGIRGRVLSTKGFRGTHGDLPFVVIGQGVRSHNDGELAEGFGSFARIACDCGAHADRKVPPGRLNVHVLSRNFEFDGWVHLSKDRWRCPECLRQRKAAAKGESPKDPVIATPAPPPRPELPKSKLRDIARAVDALYDPLKDKWLLGMSEELLAKSLGVTIADVRRVRHMTPEKLAEHDSMDEELLALKAMIADGKRRIEDLLTEYVAVEATMADASKRCDLLEQHYKVATGKELKTA